MMNESMNEYSLSSFDEMLFHFIVNNLDIVFYQWVDFKSLQGIYSIVCTKTYQYPIKYIYGIHF